VRALGTIVAELARTLHAPADASLLALAAECAGDAPPAAVTADEGGKEVESGGIVIAAV
jgi:hypothetical protein